MQVKTIALVCALEVGTVCTNLLGFGTTGATQIYSRRL